MQKSKIVNFLYLLILLSPIATFAQFNETKSGQSLGKLNHDFNRDGKIDKANLVQREDVADLIVQFGANNGYGAPIIAREFVGSYPMIGDPAKIRTNNNGGIIVESSHIGIGRHKYEAQTTIAFRNGQLVVAGYTISRWDSIDPNAASRCDVNFLNGRAIIYQNDRVRNVRHQLRAKPIQNWRDQIEIEQICPQ